MNNLDEEWENWKITHGRNYNRPNEDNIRRGIWEDNMLFIEAHNQKFEQGLSSFCLAMNFFGDMTIMNHRDEAWKNWKITYGKIYEDQMEESYRRAIWENNMSFIEAHNQKYEQGLTTFCLRMYHYGDKTPEEMP